MKNMQQRRVHERVVYREMDLSAARSAIVCNGCVETKEAFTVGSSEKITNITVVPRTLTKARPSSNVLRCLLRLP